MSFVITGDRDDLIATFAPLERFVGVPGGVTHNTHVVFSLKDGLSYAEASDQRMSLRLHVYAMCSEPEVNVLIHPKMRRALAALPAGGVTITHTDGSGLAELTSAKGKARYEVPIDLLTVYPNIFPGLEDVTWDDVQAVNAKDALDAMGRGARFVSKKDTQGNPSITGINLRVVDDKLAIDATDGIRCYQEKVALPDKGFPFGEEEVILPTGMIDELRRLFPSGEAKLTADVNRFYAADVAKGTFFVANRIGGKYPNMDTLIKDDEYKLGIDVPRVDLIDALKRLTTLVGSKPVKLSIHDSEIDLHSQGDEGAADEWVALANPAAEMIVVGYNLEHLYSALEAFDADVVTMSWTTPLRPTIMRADGEDKRFVLMPVRV